MAGDRRQTAADDLAGPRGSTAARRRLVIGGGIGVAAACLLLIGGLVGFAWGMSAGDPSRQITGVVDNVNDDAIVLTGVEGAEGGEIGAAFVANPDFEIHRGDKVFGTFVEFNEPDRINTFIVEKIVGPSSSRSSRPAGGG